MIYDIQRAPALKRVSAFLLDFILLTIIGTGMMFLASIILDVDGHQEKLEGYYTYYEEKYSVEFNLTEEEIDAMSEEERAHYEEVEAIIQGDEDLIKEYNLVISLTLVIWFIGIFFGTMIVEFVIPLIFKNGQTVGKKVFSLVVIKNNSVKASNVQLFVRALFGKFIIGLMIPIYLIVMMMFGVVGITGIIVIGLLVIFQLIMYYANKNRTFIHDVISFTVVCDKESQMIFETDEDMVKYKEELHKANAANISYK